MNERTVTVTCTLDVRISWWLMPYLHTLAFICKRTGMRPNVDRLNRLLAKAVKIEAKPVH